MILVKPGERIAADAKVVENSAAVDESLLTGESVPVQKHPSDNVYAGTAVLDSMIIAKVTRIGAESRLGQITKIVEATLNQKPPIQKLADKASRYFAWGIVGISIVTFLGWWLTGSTPSVALLHAVAVLVVACPCALGLATPLAIAVSLGRTAQKGLLVRNPSALEIAAFMKRVVFDKTGTLTQGRLSIVAIAVDESVKMSEEDFVCIAAGVEQYSEHPLAQAIVQASHCQLPQTKEFQSGKGRGVSALVKDLDDKEVRIGAQEFAGPETSLSLQAKAEAHHQKGETVVWVGWEGRCRGFFAFHDEINESASETLKLLNEMSVKSVMVSGDDPRTVKTVASMLDISDYHGGVTPEEKAADIKHWQEADEKVAMIGDGVNDAPALAQADLSFTTASGTDVAGETSDVVLTRDDLAVIPWFIRFSQKTNRIIRENLGWAFAYNLISVPLAAFGIISPVIAAVAMASSSLLVVGNSLRLKR
jgi:Cu+-exporting ATPase